MTVSSLRTRMEAEGANCNRKAVVSTDNGENCSWHDEIKSASKLLAAAMDRLGLEDRHETRSKPSALYKKVSLAVFPPFKSSLNYSHGQGDAEPANPTSNRELVDDEDVALPVTDQHGLTSILNMLAAVLAFAGSTSMKAIGSILHEHDFFRKEGENRERNVPDTRHEQEEADLQPSDGGTRTENLPRNNGNPENNTNAATKSKSHTKGNWNSPRSVPIHRTSTSGLTVHSSGPHRLRRGSTLSTLGTLASGSSDDTKLMYSGEIMAKALLNDDYRPPPENLRSTWENSVMANHHLKPSGDHVLIRYEQGQNDLVSDSSDKLEILKYHIALKLKETFDFDDDNYLYDHFDVWLIKDVLLQGHMYITRDAVCFYSLLPGKFSATELNDPELTLHAGALGHKLAHYGDAYFSSVYTNRFWAVLKPETLSIYTSPTKLYFPVRTIDLRNAISCEIIEPTGTGLNQSSPANSPYVSQTPTEPLMSQLNSELSSMAEEDTHEENVQSGVWFKINCTDKTYRFHTSSIYSARHWYNSISKAIFLLQNTNDQHEVIMRLPVEDIIDYKKNYVLAEGDGHELPEAQEKDNPISFSIMFNLQPYADETRMQKLKHKAKKLGNSKTTSDSAHFVVFHKGHELTETFEQALEANVIESSSRNHRNKKKTKNFFREDRADSISLGIKRPQKVVTTVQPEFASSQSVIDKIVQVNAKIMQARERELAKVTDAASSDTLHRGAETEGKRYSYVPSLRGMKDKLLPKSCSNNQIATNEDNTSDVIFREEVSLPQDFVVPDFDYHLHFPRPFSLLMLQNLDIQMVRRTRTFDEIALQYGNLSGLLKERRAKEHAKLSGVIAEEVETDAKNEHADSPTAVLDSEEQSQNSGKRRKARLFRNLVRSVSSMGGVWSAKPEHYDRVLSHDKYYVGSSRVKIKALNNFRNHFSLGPDSHLVSTYHAQLKRGIPVFGRLYVGKDQLCFRSKIPGVSTKMVLPLRDIQSCNKQNRAYRYYGLLFKIKGLDDLQLLFGSREARDDCQRMILKLLKKENLVNPDSEFNQDDDLSSSLDVDESERQNRKTDDMALSRIRSARLKLLEDKVSYASGIDMPLLLEDNPFTTTEVKLSKRYKITLLTIGSRGDVQPYIALGKALIKEGHEVTIATHQEFEDWIKKYGIHFKEIAGNPAELMLLMVTHGSISVGFLKEASAKFRGWIGELLESSWKACQGAELLIESPSAMAGLHIAEALNIPYMRAFTMPWTRTRAYPHAFLVPDQYRGGSYNFLTHVMFENVFWKGISGQVNRWRVETLGLPRTSLVKMQQSRVPFLYNISPAMFPPSVDFPDWVKVTGYWFLDEGSDDYQPPKELLSFLDEAKSNNEKVVYIGFGSIVVSDAKALTKTIAEAVVDLGVKCILNKGWSDKLSKNQDNADEPEVELPPQVYDAGMIPHDWLFTRIDGAVHHGGSGTTGATLRAGLPTIIKPFFGDQFFYASRVEDLGVGLTLKHLNKKSFTKALKAITSDEKYRNKAVELARAMSHERGVLSAVEAIYTELTYSKSLVLGMRHDSEQRKNTEDRSGIQTPVIDEAFEMMQQLKRGDSSDGESSDEQDESGTRTYTESK